MPTHCTCRAHTVHILCACRAHAVHMPCTCRAHPLHMPCTCRAHAHSHADMQCTYPGLEDTPVGTPTTKAAQPMLCTIVEKASTCCIHHAMSASTTGTCTHERVHVHAPCIYRAPGHVPCTAHVLCIHRTMHRLCIHHALLYTILCEMHCEMHLAPAEAAQAAFHYEAGVRGRLVWAVTR